MVPFLHRMAPSTMEENPLWLVVLCDMMTNLMLFFLVMFVFTQQDAQAQRLFKKSFEVEGLIENPKERTAEQAVREFKQENAWEKLQALFGRKELAGAIEVKEDEDSIRVSLVSRILFRSGEAELDPKAYATIARLADILKDIENEVVVEGHTDAVPIRSGPYRTNWELSVARSYSVIERFMADGVAPERLVAAGYGEFHPAAPNGTREGRARNRRIEIVIIRTELEKKTDRAELDRRMRMVNAG